MHLETFSRTLCKIFSSQLKVERLNSDGGAVRETLKKIVAICLGPWDTNEVRKKENHTKISFLKERPKQSVKRTSRCYFLPPKELMHVYVYNIRGI